MAGDLHRTAQPPTLATFRSWGSSAGAGRVRPAGANIRKKNTSRQSSVTSRQKQPLLIANRFCIQKKIIVNTIRSLPKNIVFGFKMYLAVGWRLATGYWLLLYSAQVMV